MHPTGLYIHIPFCRQKCLYCDFVSYAIDDISIMDRYVNALQTELSILGTRFSGLSIETIFIGGGTPSVLPVGLVSRILNTAYDSFNISSNAEITIEANPNTLTPEKLKEYIDSDINRISLGIQSANDRILKRIGRIHTFDEAVNTFNLARASGFHNINIDIMYGLPGQSIDDYITTIDQIASLSPEHISAYSLILEPKTPLHAFVNDGKRIEYTLPNEDDEYSMHLRGAERLKSFGYKRYEISNYAKPGFECRHNINYWKNGAYIGVGAAAHSAYHDNDAAWVRSCNTDSIEQYIYALENSMLPIESTDYIPLHEEMFETLMVGFRMTRGISDADFTDRFNISVFDAYPNSIKTLKALDYIKTDKTGITMTSRGFDMLNSALLVFLDEPFGS